MYKRRARILFVATDPADVACAQAAIGACGARWAEAAADARDTPIDLVVTLDDDAARGLPAIAVPHKHWPIGAPRAEDIRQRVAGLVGGMRLLAAMDKSPPPVR